MKPRVYLCVLAASLSVLFLRPLIPAWAAPADPAGKPVDFDRDIRPILSDNCFACHGPDEQQRKAKLRLDTKEGAFADRGGYQVIAVGDAAKSKLYQRISAPKPAMRMPPPAFDRTLNETQVGLLRRWIDQGAKWETHWSYVPPVRHDPPAVKTQSWVRNPIDNFILARLEREGLKPSSEAAKPTLLRRVSLDLTGLPPTPAEVDVFLADKSPNAYEKQVDRLLASSHYGERMAMQWLDIARYADSHGYHIDSHREMWHWRDWVIRSFNENLPFDQFTVQQLAGDLLPNATRDQILATGFNRNHMINFEGGAIPEEYQTEYVVDRVETTSAAWLGMTLGCSRCHDHKYDPIKQRDFYRFFAFFNTIPEKGLDGRWGNAKPMLMLPTQDQQQHLDQLDRALTEHEKALGDDEIAASLKEWESTRLASIPAPPTQGLTAHYELDGNFVDSSGGYHPGRTLHGELTYGPAVVGQGAEFDGQTLVELGNLAAFDRSDPFSIAMWERSSDNDAMIVLQKIDKEHRGYEIALDNSVPIGDLKRGVNVIARLISKWPDEAIEIKTKERVPRFWNHIAVTYDGSGKASGLKLYVNGQLREVETVHDNLGTSIQNTGVLQIGNNELGVPFRGRMDDLRIYSRQLAPVDLQQLAIHQPIRQMLFNLSAIRLQDEKDKTSKKPETELEKPELDGIDLVKDVEQSGEFKKPLDRLRDYFLTYDAPETLRKQYAELQSLRAEKIQLIKTMPTSMVMREAAEPRETHILGRGDYRNLGEKVTPAVPSVLPPLPPGVPANRLALARWLVDPTHPLTARVAVNRYWQNYFGIGLVKTSEDFGSQGEAPSHPELLDWLATEFIRTGWDVKVMQRLIVTSAAYRQSSSATPEMIEKDPENRLLSHASRFRLPAEMVRDSALSAAGLLVGEVGGPSVYPYQPKGLWEELAFGDVYSAQTYTPSTGPDLYRRTMYTFWKRTAPPASLSTFDAPDREKCTARRARTNTPLQALVLMNDPTYVEAARVLAERVIRQAGRDPVKRIDMAFRLATARKPESQEMKILQEIAQQQTATYRNDKAAAAKLISMGESKVDPKLDVSELAAWTTVTSTILNLDEAITKE